MFYKFSNIYLLIQFALLASLGAQPNQEMVELGRTQYQLLKERQSLPTYGTCWKTAIEQIEARCESLSEDTQSMIALHLANCFLEMSGHESYNCELEIKPNLKQICISSMSDRAFNVYTEFYTHTQNICWFLRGQIWQETIAENTYQVGKQLQESAKNQEVILRMQKESLDVQEKLLKHGHSLEKIMEEFYVSTLTHQETLSVMSSSLKSLQSWLVGEFSWIDLLIFYISTSIIVIIVTSTQQTAKARFPIWILLFVNAGVERFIYMYVLKFHYGDNIYGILSEYIWWSRRGFFILALITLVYFAYRHKDLNVINNNLLETVRAQNTSILGKLDELKKNQLYTPDDIYCVQEKFCKFPSNSSVQKPFPVPKNSSKSKKAVCRNDTLDDYSSKVLLQKSFKYNLRSNSPSPRDKH